MKYYRRLLIFFLLVGLVAVGLGYYHGLRPDNVDQYITDLLKRFTSTSDTISTEEIPKPTGKSKPSSRSKTKERSGIELQPLPPNPFEKIDRHARKCPESAKKDTKSLADYLIQAAQTDIEKARAIYIWLTDNIEYDDAAYNTGNYGDYSADGVLTSRKAVCEGFSNLYLALGQEMGLEIEKVSGYAKGFGYTSGQKLTNTNHTWNLMKINGRWRLFDATWGQGNGKNIGGKLVSKKEFDNYWFNVDPYEGIFNHMPKIEA